MGASRTEAFCTRSCPFSFPSSSFTSRSLQNWTRSVSRNASESGWKRSNWRSRKPPVRPREPRAAAVSDFPGTAGRRTHRKLKTARCAAVREHCGKRQAQNEQQREKLLCGKRKQDARKGKTERFWTLRRKGRTKPRGRARPAAVTSARGAGSFGDLRGRSKHSEKQPEGVAE